MASTSNSGVSSGALTPEEIAMIPETIREKVKLSLDQIKPADNSQRFKIETEQEVFELQQELGETSRKLDSAFKSKQELEARISSMEQERNSRVENLHRLELEKDQTDSEKNELRRKCDMLSGEKADLMEVLTNRKEIIDSLRGQIDDLNEQIKAFTVERCQTMLQIEDIKNKEMSLELREKRWNQEKEFMEQEKKWYSDEVGKKDEQLFALRKETTMQKLEYEGELSKKAEEVSELKENLSESRKRVDELCEQIETLNTHLKESAEENLTAKDNFDRELKCQTELTTMFKNSSLEAEKRVEELTQALEDVEKLCSESKERHFVIQQQMEQQKQAHATFALEKNEEIEALHDELKKANELLRSKHRVMLTDEEIAELSPGAAAASRLIKSGTTLTQIYRDHSKIVEELEQKKVDNSRLERYIKEIVQDIANKAPILKQRKDELERVIYENEQLKSQLRRAANEEDSISSQKDTVLRELKYTKAELERYQRDNADLSAQVRQLLQCVESSRSGYNQDSDPAPEDLFLFRNIDELQSTNQRLMSALKEAEAKREEMVKAAQEAEMSKMKFELESTIKELNSLKDHREKQNKVIETICDQRNKYKELYEETRKENIATSQLIAHPPAKSPLQSERSQADTAKIQEEFDFYWKEKCEVEKILNDKIDSLSGKVAQLSTSNGKLAAEVEYQAQRFKVLQGNAESYKREVELFRQRSEGLSSNIAKADQKITDLTRQLLEKQEEIAHQRVEIRSLTESLATSRRHEEKARMEVESLRQGEYNNTKLISSLQELQVRLDRTDATKNLKLHQDQEALSREKTSLQQTITSMSEEHKQYVRDMKEKLSGLQSELEEKSTKLKSTLSQLQWSERMRKETEDKSHSLQQEIEKGKDGNKDASAERFQKEAQQLQTRLNYLEVQYHEVCRKLADAEQQQKKAEADANRFQDMSGNMETSLRRQREADQAVREKLESKLAQIQASLDEAALREQALLLDKTDLAGQTDALKARIEALTSESQDSISKLESALNEIKTDKEEWVKKEAESRKDRDARATEAMELQEKYLTAAQEKDNLSKELEEKVSQLSQTSSQLEEAVSNQSLLKSEIEAAKNEIVSKESTHSVELKSQEERIASLTEQNKKLFEEVQKLGNQISVLEKSGEGGGLPGSVETASTESTSSLVEVIRNLRSEREFAENRAQEAELNISKMTSNERQLEERLLELKKELAAAKLAEQSLAEGALERSRLLNQIQSLETIHENSKRLTKEKAGLEDQLKLLTDKLSSSEAAKGELSAEKTNAELAAQKLEGELKGLQAECAQWQQRHQQLMEQKSKFESTHLSQIRKDLSEKESSLIDSQKKLKDLQDEHTDSLSQLVDIKQNYEELQAKELNQARILDQARKLARKYKSMYENSAKQVAELQASGTTPATATTDSAAATAARNQELETLKTKNEELEKTRKDLEERCARLEAEKSIPQEGGKQLKEKIEIQETKLEEMKRALSTTAQKMIASRKQNAQLVEEVRQLKEAATAQEEAARKVSEALKIAEKSAQTGEEHKFRADLLDKKVNELSAQLRALSDESLGAEKAGPSDPPAPGSNVVLIQPVSAMPNPSERASAAQESMKPPFRGRPSTTAMAAIRPIPSHQQRRATVQPTSLSPGPALPDQSSSSVGSSHPSVAPVQVVVSTTHQPVPLPQAVVSPHPQQDVVGSSTSSLSVEADEPMAANVQEGVASTSAAAKRTARTEQESLPVPKRSRTDSPEQVSTSDQVEDIQFSFRPIEEDKSLEEEVEEGDEEEVEEVEGEEGESEDEDEGMEGDGEDEEDLDDDEADYDEDNDTNDASRSLLSHDEEDDDDEIQFVEEVNSDSGRVLSQEISGTDSWMPRNQPSSEDSADDGILPTTPSFPQFHKPETSGDVPQSSYRYAMAGQNPSHSVSDYMVEEGGQDESMEGMPTTSQSASATLVGEDTEEGANASSSTIENVFLQPEVTSNEPGGKDDQNPNESERKQTEQESEQAESGASGSSASTGVDDSTGPSSSGQKSIKLRKPIVWSDDSDKTKPGPSSGPTRGGPAWRSSGRARRGMRGSRGRGALP